MHRKNHTEESLSQFYLKHGRMPVHDDGFYLHGSEEDHNYQMAVKKMININKTEISDVRNKSELSEKVEVENEKFINIKDIPNETSEDIYLTGTLDTAKEDEKNRINNTNELLECMEYKNIEKQQQMLRRYSITSTNKAYGDSLEMFDHTNVFSSGVSVF